MSENEDAMMYQDRQVPPKQRQKQQARKLPRLQAAPENRTYSYPLYPMVYVSVDETPESENEELDIDTLQQDNTNNLTCKICHKICGNMGSLQRHLVTHKMITCDACNGTFEGKEKFREHKKACRSCDGNQFKARCKYCNKLFKHKGNLKNHMALHTQESITDESLRCKFCDKICGNQGSLSIHMAIHEPEKKTKNCRYCDAIFSDRFQLKKHVRICAKAPQNIQALTNTENAINVPGDANKFKCTFCGKICGNKGSYKIHVLCYHNISSQIKCNNCDKKFEDKIELEKHIKRSLRKDKTSNEFDVILFKCAMKGKKYLKRCSQCPLMFNSRELKNHILRVHGRDIAFICKFCGKGYDMLAKLEIHERQHTGERPFECDICGKGFISHATLKDHKSRHGALPQHECEICKKKFRHKAELRQHRLIHDKNARIYVCHICGASHYKKQALEKHQMIHTRERPFQCDVCGKSFSYRDVLKRHMETHTGSEPPAYCEICGKGFSSKLHINRHLLIHTGERPHECDICKQTFVQASALRTHRMLRHKILPYECNFCGERFKIKMDMLGHIDENHRSLQPLPQN